MAKQPNPKKMQGKAAPTTNPLGGSEYSRLVKKEKETNSAIITRALERQKKAAAITPKKKK